jgi:hypothetical protein
MAGVPLNVAEFEARAAVLGLAGNQSAQARKIGCAPSIHNRVLQRKRHANAVYVVGVLMLVGSDEVRRELAALFDLPGTLQADEREPVAS